VELPVGATEDRLTGSLDLGRALTEGVTSFQPGLLAAAHRGVLYVDEVNLLHDHLVDLLLDAAALGTNYVERDGVSVRHEARFLLVGTMNPEEGELRPQLLDRFGLTVEAAAPRDPASRAEVVRRRIAFDAAPVAFAERFAASEAVLAAAIAAAQQRLPSVAVDDAALERIAEVCASFGVDGLRADIVIARTAAAHAAWRGAAAVSCAVRASTRRPGCSSGCSSSRGRPTRLTTSTSLTGQPRRAAAKDTDDGCGSTRSRAGPSSRARVEPMP
jgi:magnesium chelatase subunit D